MARRGSSKVRTGCATCKIRKVKCDETWPQCLRCKKTGRSCDGYRAPPPGSLSWDVLLRPQPSPTSTCDMTELRSLAFFHQAVAPVLSGPFDTSFWTHVVAQATHHEPAARHAVLAISSFFEDFCPTTCRAKDNPWALRHYNQAIQRVVTSQVRDIDSILILCVLFICIEFLREDEKAAINHVACGVRILSAAPSTSKLAAVFSHMSIFPLFFGGTISDFPILKHGPKATETFYSIIEAQHSLDILAARAVRFVRISQTFEIVVVPEDSPAKPTSVRQRQLRGNGKESFARLQVVAEPGEDQRKSMLDEQDCLGAAIDSWGDSFARFQATRSPFEPKDPASLALKIRWLVSKIWVRNCLEDEMVYDEAKAEFESIVDMARCAASNSTTKSTNKKFMFDMGFGPLLHFVVVKCRYLDLRVAALALMNSLSCPRESLWNAATMDAVGVRSIEVEHGIELTPDAPQGHAEDAELPPEENRILGYHLEEPRETVGEDGVVLRQRCMCIVMPSAEGAGGIRTRREWITVHT
ncbi:hypothetical protein QQZ08_006484 [Neonectria magnoliae]|uniref:Zn(2)-C6 fungal-type domain-containing protein n=1 Tax=Neonectria magnoliae TaxID=2732573 RepID=A0ABR1I293_9HYPO